MAIMIKIGDLTSPLTGLFYLDATTQFNRTYKGKISTNPLDSGAQLSDHYSADNPVVNISGVISGVDFSPIPPMLLFEGEQVMNQNPQPVEVNVTNQQSSWRQFVPDSIDQFLPNADPALIVDTGSRQDFKDMIEELMSTVMSGVFYNDKLGRWQNYMTPITIVETDGVQIVKAVGGYAFTGFSIKEDTNTGESLHLEMTLEKPRFADSMQAEAPKPAKGSSAATKAAKTQDKGVVSTNEVGDEEKANIVSDRVYSTDLLGMN